jgi:hypothetical protein
VGLASAAKVSVNRSSSSVVVMGGPESSSPMHGDLAARSVLTKHIR